VAIALRHVSGHLPPIIFIPVTKKDSGLLRRLSSARWARKQGGSKQCSLVTCRARHTVILAGARGTGNAVSWIAPSMVYAIILVPMTRQAGKR
jgi:hypothetical protein